jgi:PKD repeat protein
VLSTATQLVNGGNPAIPWPQGLALDVVGTSDYVAVQIAADNSPNCIATGTCGSAGIAQVCATGSCGTSGAITAQWSSEALNGLPNSNTSESSFFAAGISTVPKTTSPNVGSTAPPGSLTNLLNEGSVQPSDMDVVDVPADLSSTPTILSTYNIGVQNPGQPLPSPDGAAVFTSDQAPQTIDSNGNPQTVLASPQIVALSNGLYASEFEPDPTTGPDPESPSGAPGLWTAHDPSIRLLKPGKDGTLSNVTPPLMSLFDTLGNPTTNSTGATEATSACNLSDQGTALAGPNASPYPSLAAGAAGSIWVLTRGTDSSDLSGVLPNANPTGGRELIELAPGAGAACPAPSATFTVANGNGTPQPASTSNPLTVVGGSTVNFDASTIKYRGAATSAYVWDLFGDGKTPPRSILGGAQWPTPVTSQTYTTPGLYTVTLKLFGDFGEYDTSGQINVVSNKLPRASFTVSPPNAQTNTPVSFDASGSAPSASPGATITHYKWDWGDRQIDDTPSAIDAHAYSTPGTYTVRLTVVDSAYGHSPIPATQTVTVTAAPPTATATTPTPLPTTLPPSPSNAFALSGVRVRGHDVVVALKLPDPGTVKILASFKGTVKVKVGHGTKTRFKRKTKMITFARASRMLPAGAERVILAPSAAAFAALRGLSKHSSLKLSLVVTFTPTGGKPASKLASLRITGLKAKK